jgi:hypothetical protein
LRDLLSMPVAAIDVGDELPVGASEQAIEPHCLREGLLEVRGNGLQPRLGLAESQAHRQRRLVLLLLVLLLAGLAPAPAALTGTGCPARRSAAGGRALPTAAAQAWCIAALPTCTRDARAAQVGLEARALDRLRLQAAQWSRLGGSVACGTGLSAVRPGTARKFPPQILRGALADSDSPEQTQKSFRLSAD